MREIHLCDFDGFEKVIEENYDGEKVKETKTLRRFKRKKSDPNCLKAVDRHFRLVKHFWCGGRDIAFYEEER